MTIVTVRRDLTKNDARSCPEKKMTIRHGLFVEGRQSMQENHHPVQRRDKKNDVYR